MKCILVHVFLYAFITGLNESECKGGGNTPAVPSHQPTTPTHADATLGKPVSLSQHMSGTSEHEASDSVGKIVGGVEAKKNEIPWQISIQFKKNHICGAVVLSDHWVVTAAHCLDGVDKKTLSVVGGEHMLDKDENEQRRNLSNYKLHSKFDITTGENDIALIQLAEPLKIYGITVKPVPLSQPGANYPGLCRVSGWGHTREGGQISNTLRMVWLPLISDEECRAKYEDTYNIITENMICAAHPTEDKGVCNADSGGPLTCIWTDNQHHLVGLVSWGIKCGRPEYPGVYTEVRRQHLPLILPNQTHQIDISTGVARYQIFETATAGPLPFRESKSSGVADCLVAGDTSGY